MKELINKIKIAGKLVKKDIEEFINKKGEDAIGGSLIIRTADGSEHEVNIYSNKYKKDENKHLTSETTYFYNEYTKIKDTYKDIETAGLEDADVISIDDGNFRANDFLSPADKTKLISSNRISARFINKVEARDIESTPMVATFEVEGIVETIKDEIIKEIPTGNLTVKLNAISQTADGFGKDAKYEVDSFIPIKFIVGSAMVAGFKSAGYYDGCYAKFVGDLINTKEVVEIAEKQAFGPDKIDRKTLTNRKYEIKSGSVPSTIFEHELDQAKIDALKAKRKQTIAEVMAGKGAKTEDTPPFTPDTTTPAPSVAYNPFAQQ